MRARLYNPDCRLMEQDIDQWRIQGMNECGSSFDPVRASEIYIAEHATRIKY